MARRGSPKPLSFRGLGADPDEKQGLLGAFVGYARLFDPRTYLSPRARVGALGGYQLPLDRHDCVLERCGGEKVEYVIEFYQGKSKATTGSAGMEESIEYEPNLDKTERIRWEPSVWKFIF